LIPGTSSFSGTVNCTSKTCIGILQKIHDKKTVATAADTVRVKNTNPQRFGEASFYSQYPKMESCSTLNAGGYCRPF
jgi:hypothetical protein